MLAQVDEAGCYSDSFYYGFFKLFRLTDYGYNRAVMIFVGFIIKQFYVFFSAEGGYNLFQNFRIAAVTKVGNTFNYFIHHKKLLRPSTSFASVTQKKVLDKIIRTVYNKYCIVHLVPPLYLAVNR